MVARLEFVIAAEELGHPIPECRVARHTLGIKGFQETVRFVRFQASPQLFQQSDRVGLGEGGMPIIRPRVSPSILTYE